MHPILFRLGPWEARSYGLMLAFSVLFGVLLARYRARSAGVDPQRILQLSILMVIAILVGSRLAYVIVNYSEFADDWLRAVNFYADGKLRLTGLVMNGGVVACLLVMWLFCRRTGTPTLRLFDIYAPALALGIFLTRIGCLLNGCCYGEPTALVWGVVFPPGCPAGDYQRLGGGAPEPLHPTQLYSSFYGLLIFVVLLTVEKVAERKGRRFDGFTTLLLFLLYPAARFTVEFFRHFYDETGVYLGLTHNQYLSIVLFAASLGGMVFLSRRRRKTNAGAPRNGDHDDPSD